MAVGRIDPDIVRVFAAGSSFEYIERLAAVFGLSDVGGNDVKNVRILRIDPDTRAVPALAVSDASIADRHVLPRSALIIGAIESGILALRRIANNVNSLALCVCRYRDADAARVRGQR